MAEKKLFSGWEGVVKIAEINQPSLTLLSTGGGGGGGSKCPRHFKMFVAVTEVYKSDPDFFTFPKFLSTKDLTKNFEKIMWGSPRFSPSKKVAQEYDPTMAAYDPHFLSQNLFLL